MNGYTKMLKESERNFKAKRKMEEARQKELQEVEERIKNRDVARTIIDGIILRKEQEELINKKNDIRKALAGNLPYKLWVTCWDLLNGSYYQVRNDLQNGKINKDEVMDVIDKMNSIHNIINIEYLNIQF